VATNDSQPLQAVFAANLRRFREDARLSQTDVAERFSELGELQLWQQTIAKIENGQRDVSLNEAQLLARAVGQPLAVMLTTPPELLSGQAARDRLKQIRDEIKTTADDLVRARTSAEDAEHGAFLVRDRATRLGERLALLEQREQEMIKRARGSVSRRANDRGGRSHA
jgi:transcriptional regulator with XRE-family HTH domain